MSKHLAFFLLSRKINISSTTKINYFLLILFYLYPLFIRKTKKKYWAFKYHLLYLLNENKKYTKGNKKKKFPVFNHYQHVLYFTWPILQLIIYIYSVFFSSALYFLSHSNTHSPFQKTKSIKNESKLIIVLYQFSFF